MTSKHSAPSKYQTLFVVALGALGFSLLFMFAVSGFVNMITQTKEEATQEDSHMADTSHSSAPEKPKTVASKPASSPAEKTVSLGQMLAKGDAKKGAKVAKKCLACHSFEKGGKNKVGPNLYGVVGRKIATHKGFNYSPAMSKHAKAATSWSYENLVPFLKKPKKIVPKTKMAFPGIRKDRDLANLIAYLRSNSDTAVPLPAL